MASSAPFRVRYGGDEHKVVLIGPGATEAGIEKAVALRVGLSVGSFGIRNADGVPSTFHAGLTGDWDVVLLPPPPVAGACVVGVWVRGDEGTLWRASGGGRDGLTAGLC